MVLEEGDCYSPPALLFCPADDERKLRRLPERGAAAVALDLEDAVAPARRERARQLLSDIGPVIAAALRTYVRVNPWGSPDLELDIACVRSLPIAGVLLPKVETRDQVLAIDKSIVGGTDVRGAPKILPMIETARGLLNVSEIASAAVGRIETLVLGTADLSADLGLTLSAGEPELAPYRATVVASARAAGLAGPIDGPELNLDAADFAGSCERSRRAGFSGRVCLTPDQAVAARTGYTQLAPDELDRLRDLVEVFEAAQAEGFAVARIDGVFVDPPVYLQACRELNRHFAHANRHTDKKGQY